MASKNSRLRKPILIHKNRKQAATARVLRGPVKLRRKRRAKKAGSLWA